MDYRKYLSEPWFSFIYSGQKTIEALLDKEECKKMKEGDTIIFYNERKECKKIIKKITKYLWFMELLCMEDLTKVLPGINDTIIGYKIYTTIYSSNEEWDYGVLAIHLQ